MTRQEFVERFRGRMMVFLMESWACRRENASDQGRLMDSHTGQIKTLLFEMYESLAPKHEANGTNGTNGHAPVVGAAKIPNGRIP